jgi:hypothetical protein
MRNMVPWWVMPCAMLTIACENGAEAPAAQLRAIALAKPGSHVEIDVDERMVASGRAEDVLGRLLPVDAGLHQVAVAVDSHRFAAQLRVAVDVDYTLVFGGDERPTVIADASKDDEAPLASAPSARFVHASSTAGLVDVYLSPPEASLAALAPTTLDLSGGDVTAFEPTTRGVQRLRLTRAGHASEVLFDSGPVSLPAMDELSFVLLDKLGGGLTFMVPTATGAVPLEALDPCAAGVADNDAASARPYLGPVMVDGLCAAADVDFYKFDLPASTLAVVEVSTAGLTSSLNPVVELSSPSLTLDRAGKDAAGKATSRVLLFGGQTYFVKVSDAAGRGGAGFTYELRVTSVDAAPQVDATGGNFSAGSNNPDIAAFEGQFVALSAQSAAATAIDFKSMVRVTGLGANVYEFVFDPALAVDGVLRVLLGNGQGPLPTVQARSSLAGNLRAFDALSDWFVAEPTSRTTLRARNLAMGVAFPTRSMSWTLTTDPLTLPVVTATELTSVRNAVKVTFNAPARAKTFELSTFGRESTVTGKSNTKQSPTSIRLAGRFSATEAYVVRISASDVRVGDGSVLAAPLGAQARNLSEFLFYSDAQ